TQETTTHGTTTQQTTTHGTTTRETTTQETTTHGTTTNGTTTHETTTEPTTSTTATPETTATTETTPPTQTFTPPPTSTTPTPPTQPRGVAAKPSGCGPARARIRLISGSAERGECAHDRAVRDMGDERDDRRPDAVVQEQEPGRLEERDRRRRRELAPHPRVDERQEHVDENGAREDPVKQPEDGAEPPTARPERGEEQPVADGEQHPGDEVRRVSDRL